jgi:branched-chain amino acid transport system ATP-binding protein
MQAADMSEADVLTVRNITSGYGGSAVLRDVSLTLARGEALAVLGKNGMGKTTLLKTIFGLIPPRGGDIRFEGSPQSSPSPSQLTALGVSYAPQEQPLFQDLSVRDNLRLALPRDSASCRL